MGEKAKKQERRSESGEANEKIAVRGKKQRGRIKNVDKWEKSKIVRKKEKSKPERWRGSGKHVWTGKTLKL